MTSRFTSLFIPSVIALLSLYLSVYVDKIPAVWLALLEWLPYIFSSLVILLAWHFNKGLVLIVCLILMLPLLPIDNLGNQNNVSVYLLLTSLNLALVSQLQERGFFNRFAVNRIIFVAMQLLWCMALAEAWIKIPGISLYLINIESFSFALAFFTLTFVISLSFLASKWWLKSDTFSGAILVSLLLIALMHFLSLNSKQTALMHTGVFVIWCIYLLIDSHKMAYVDELTQLPGRRALNEKLLGLSKHYVIAMLDVDHFKKFNDTYGHDMGDLVLKSVANNMDKVTSGGKAFRYGGEEFAIVFAHKKKEDILSALEGVRESIASQMVDIYDSKKGVYKGVSVTISIGAALSNSERHAQDVIKHADQLLYKAKKKGRNCVIIE
ncbi:MAG: GGDEF domain-containing protein [Marinomonas sp.]